MTIQLLSSPELIEQAIGKSKEQFLADPDFPCVPALLTIPLSEEILFRRLKSNAIKMVNHFRGVMRSSARSPYKDPILDLLNSTPEGMGKELLCSRVDPGRRNWKQFDETLAHLMAEGLAARVKIPQSGKRSKIVVKAAKFLTTDDISNGVNYSL